ncbi:MAG: 23S rRNA (uracil(1939)-C(5))-methyltransferase RlmD [bacterium]
MGENSTQIDGRGPRPVRGSQVEVRVEAIDDLGRGRGEVDGHPVAVRGAVPGSLVRAEIRRRHRGAIGAQLEEVLEPGPFQREARCPHVGTCGGCSFQTYDYAGQLEALRGHLLERLEEAELLGEVEVEPVLGMEEPFGYRNKMDFTFGNRRWIEVGEPEGVQSDFALGLHVPGVYSKVLDIQSCAIHFEGADEILTAARELAREHGLEAWDTRRHVGLLRHLVLRKGVNTGEILVYLVTSVEDAERVDPWAAALVRRCPQITTLVQGIHDRAAAVAIGEEERILHGPGVIHEILAGLTFTLSPTSFFQTNTTQAERLLECIHSEIPASGGRVFDLYCGAGTIGLSLAAKVSEVVGLESSPSAIRDARANAEAAGIHNTSFLEGDVLENLEQCTRGSQGDLCIVDPPRAGLHPKVIPILLAAAPARMIYVSCNPVTAVRDLEHLARGGYRLARVQPVDLFPHTPHLECVFTLVPR